MGKGDHVQMSICVDEKEPKIHGSDYRSMARHRRCVYIALFVTLLPFVVTRSYLYCTNSDAPSGFFERQPATAGHGEDTSHEVVITPPSRAITDQDETSEVVSRSDDPELEIALPGNLTSIAGDEEEEEEVEPKEAKSSTVTSPSSLNTTSNGSLSIDTGIEKNASSSSYLESLKDKTQNTTEGAEEASGREIVMEDTTAPSPAEISSQLLATEGECKLEQGKWIPDSTPPLYNSSTCKYIQAHQNCLKNGRPDDGYLYWKWKPDGPCDVPRIDPAAFFTAMRNRSVVFAGDSIARNQFQSLLCILSQAEVPRHTYWSEDGRHNVYNFQPSNVTLTIRWSPYLVHVENKLITWPDNTTETVSHIYVDELDPNWVTAVVGAEILHISTGQWWYKRAVYFEKKKALGCHGCPLCEKQLGFHIPYSKAIRNVLMGSLKIPGFNGTTVYRSFSPEHFENGAWDTGGACIRTVPGGPPMSYDTTTLYDIQKKQFKNVTDEIGKDRLKLLGITELAQSRADAHPNKYRSDEQKKSDKGINGTVPNDCLHWCLPGPIDIWNDLLVHSLHDVIFK